VKLHKHSQKQKKALQKTKKTSPFPTVKIFFLKREIFINDNAYVKQWGGGCENVYEDHNKCEYYIRELAN